MPTNSLTLELGNGQTTIILKTVGGNTLTISDDTKGITLTDQQDNTIVLSDQGVSVNSKSSLVFTAEQDITIKSKSGNISLDAAQQLQLTGLEITAKAETQLMLQAEATAELSSGAETTIKGVMVLIN